MVKTPVKKTVPGWAAGLGLLVLAVVVGLVTFLVRAGGVGQPGGSGTVAQGEVFGHVHGLAVDPGDGKLLAATHTGLYRVDGPRTAVRVSDGTHDLMGFTVVGPGRYLASGHPGEHDEGPGNLGLLESTDGGKTWKTLSLSGAADFHGLRAAHGAVYGHNSSDGAFMVSTDRRTWQRRSTVAIGSFVISPGDSRLVVAVARDGLRRSVDGGANWQPVPGGPPLITLTWDVGKDLFGADQSGGVWRSTDGGQTWQQRGTLPAGAHALTFVDGTLYAALTGDVLLASSDLGGTWTERYRPA